MSKVKVAQMSSSRGNPVPNQFIISTKEGQYFQSYDSIIAFINLRGEVTLGEDWDYSATTGKYRNQFLGEGIAETRRKLAEGIYTLDESL